VSDTGPGIGPQEQTRIFEPFDRGSAGAESPGTGLGLAIAHRIVGLLGGELRLESAVGIGSTFSFCLPFPIAAGTTRPTASSPAGPVGATGVVAAGRVLVVEDNEVNRLLAETRCGRWATRAASRAAAEARGLASTRFDAVLMDLRMPEVDGVEATVAPGARPPLGEPGPDHRGVRQRDRAGADPLPQRRDGRLPPKPVTLDSLRTMLGRWASGAPRRRHLVDTPRHQEPPSGAWATGSGPTSPTASATAPGPCLLDAFLASSHARRHRRGRLRRRSGRDHFAAHALKSAASAVAADELQAACARLEDATGAGATMTAVIGHRARRPGRPGDRAEPRGAPGHAGAGAPARRSVT
jgi:CheY-like chemotaxis protein